MTAIGIIHIKHIQVLNNDVVSYLQQISAFLLNVNSVEQNVIYKHDLDIILHQLVFLYESFLTVFSQYQILRH